MADNTQKQSGFGIGELGQILECSPEEQAIERAARETAENRAQSQSCHYCGLPATDIGSFGEPVCSGCSR